MGAANGITKKSLRMGTASVACVQTESCGRGEKMKGLRCPYCNSEEGYYMKERVHRFLNFTFDGEEDGASEDITDFTGKRKFCSRCHKILPRKMFEED